MFSYLVFLVSMRGALLDTLPYALKLPSFERASRSHAKAGFHLALSDPLGHLLDPLGPLLGSLGALFGLS